MVAYSSLQHLGARRGLFELRDRQAAVEPDAVALAGLSLPLRLDGPGVPTRDDTAAAITLVNALGEADFGGSGLRLLPSGTF